MLTTPGIHSCAHMDSTGFLSPHASFSHVLSQITPLFLKPCEDTAVFLITNVPGLFHRQRKKSQKTTFAYSSKLPLDRGVTEIQDEKEL